MDRTEDFVGETPSEKLAQKQFGFKFGKVFIFGAIFNLYQGTYFFESTMKNPRNSKYLDILESSFSFSVTISIWLSSLHCMSICNANYHTINP